MQTKTKILSGGILLLTAIILILLFKFYEKYEQSCSVGCSWNNCSTCSPGYCSETKKNCQECGGADPSKTWCDNGKPVPFPAPPPPPPCTQSQTTNIQKATPPSVIGYYGNAETKPGELSIAEISPIYNLLYMTFLEFDTNANFFLVIQGKYAAWNEGKDSLIADLRTWKNRPDPWKRTKKVYVSIGGATFQPGNIIDGNPDHIVPPHLELYPTSTQLFTGLQTFLKTYDNIFDGIDIDIENTSRDIMVGKKRSIWESFFQKIKESTNLEISACPEAADQSLTSYDFMLPYLNSYNIQFYNNGPNAISLYDISWETFNEEQKARNNPNWQTNSNAWLAVNTQGDPAWYWVLSRLAEHYKSHTMTFNPLLPASLNAAESFNCWDYAKFVKSVGDLKITHLGCWCIEQDVLNNNKFEKAILKILNG